jgi:hypothetical protein
MTTNESKKHKKNVKNVLRSKAMLVGAHKKCVREKVKVAVATELVKGKYKCVNGKYETYLYDRETDMAELNRVYHTWYDHHHKVMTRPWEHGMRIIAKKGLRKWEAAFDAAKIAYSAEVQRIGDRWDEVMQNAKEVNGDLFEHIEHLYPSAEGFVKTTSLEKAIRPIPMADDLRVSLSDSDVEVVREQLRMQHEKGLKDVYERLCDGVRHARKQLSDGKRIHSSVLHNIEDIVSALDGLNVPDEDGNINQDLEDIGNKITSELLDTDLKELKKDDELKAKKAEKAGELVDELEDKLKGYV